MILKCITSVVTVSTISFTIEAAQIHNAIVPIAGTMTISALPNNVSDASASANLKTTGSWRSRVYPTSCVFEHEADTDEEDEEILMTSGSFSALKFRSIGPAMMGGRIGDFAVDPNNHARYFAAVASGGVWKTTNAGTTYTPVFDGQASFSIGCVEIDPNNTAVVWVGTGENNSQRSVAFGDGVYKSLDGGVTWKQMGLPDSEHIGMIAIDKRDSDVVYVAAQGPLWRSGGDRGLYKTMDGGATWQRILHVDDDTGVNEVHLDPRDPDVVYATSYQRRRHVWTLINGGPGSAIYKSTDAGVTWRKLTSGIPGGDKGRIGLDISPANPDCLYAIIEAVENRGGVFRSLNRGESWKKQNSYMTTSPQYYNEIVCDPVDPDCAYFLDTILHRTEDGGKTLHRVPRKIRHVDDHALWINPDNTDHLLVGSDGGIYESFNRGGDWAFKPNLPIAQFYRVTADESTPFYYVYGGTQDNSTLGAPSRTRSSVGIANEDWFITMGGDGYETVVDPVDTNIVYSQMQYGGLVRFDRRSGERVDIKPREGLNDEPFRWNWDSPLIMSPHDRKRLYFAANILFRSDDQGDSWQAISGDLTRKLDRDALEVMGKIWPPEAICKHGHTSWYGNCVSLTESPLVVDLIYVGTDDGLIQVTEDGGKSWRTIETISGIPDMTYVSCLLASQHDADTVYAAFDNHKNSDFKPYIMKSTDRGLTWTSIVGDLPERDIVYTIAEDHVNPDLLFVGTEFGAYFTPDQGNKWIKLKSGIPTIAVRDIDIQERENDLVLGTFGRGIYILDDYSLLRSVSEELLKEENYLFPVRDAWSYIETSRLGYGKGTQGATFFSAPNPPYGAVFTYWLKEKFTTLKEQRLEAAKEAEKADEIPHYPTPDELRAEDEAREPLVFLVVRNSNGDIVRRVKGSRGKGMHRIAWDLRYPSVIPVNESLSQRPSGRLAPPGTYNVTLVMESGGVITELAGPESFEVVSLDLATFASQNPAETTAFHIQIEELQRAMSGTLRVADEVNTRLAHIRKAILSSPMVDDELLTQEQKLRERLNELLIKLRGDRSLAKREYPTKPSINSRIRRVVYSQWYTTSPPTQTQREQYQFAAEEFSEVLNELRSMVENDLRQLEEQLEEAGAPWTPGRLPKWQGQ